MRPIEGHLLAKKIAQKSRYRCDVSGGDIGA